MGCCGCPLGPSASHDVNLLVWEPRPPADQFKRQNGATYGVVTKESADDGVESVVLWGMAALSSSSALHGMSSSEKVG